MSKTSSEVSLLPLPQVDLSLFSPVCIPPTSVASSEEFAGQNATAVGWGALEYGSKPLSTFFFPCKKSQTLAVDNVSILPSPAGDYPETLQELQDLLPIVTKADCADNEWE